MPSHSYGSVQFTPADMQSAIAPAQTPPPVPHESRPTFGGQEPAPPIPSASKPKGMQLGAHKEASSGILPGGLAEDTHWDGDLMDVNADADDWSTYSHRLINSDSTLINHRCRRVRKRVSTIGWPQRRRRGLGRHRGRRGPVGCIRGPCSAIRAHPSYRTYVISIDSDTGPDPQRADSAACTRRGALAFFKSARNTAGVPRTERGRSIADCIVSLPTGSA